MFYNIFQLTMESLQDRLGAYLRHKRMTYKDFEETVGLGASAASRLSSHSYKKTFSRIAAACPDLNIEWLQTGEGEMLNRALQQTATGNGNMLAGRDVNAASPTSLDEALAALKRSQEQITALLTIIDRLTRGDD